MFPGVQGAAFQIRHLLVEDRQIAGGGRVLQRGIREPEAIVGKTRPDAAARGFVPPVLDVSLTELMCRGAKQLCAREVRSSKDQRKHVLQLIAESVRAARLIERRPSPDAARQRLIEEPAVQHQIERPVGGANLHRSQQVVPVAARLLQRLLCGWAAACRVAVTLNNLSRLGGILRISKETDQRPLLLRLERDGHLDGPAWIQSGSDAIRQRPALQGGRTRQRAVAADELRAIAGDRPALARRQIEECDALAEIETESVVSQDRAGRGIAARDEVEVGARAVLAEDPVDVQGHREPARPSGLVLEGQLEDLERLRRRHEDGQRRSDPVTFVFEGAVPLRVTNDVRCAVARRQRGCRPGTPAVAVSDEHGFSRRIAHRIVRPGGQPVVVTVARPGVTGSAVRRGKPEGIVGDDVHPGHGRDLLPPRVDVDDILPAVLCKPAETVGELQIGRPAG